MRLAIEVFGNLLEVVMSDTKAGLLSEAGITEVPSAGVDALKGREIARLTAALVAFGAAMGINACTGHATEFKKENVFVSSKNGKKAIPDKGTSIELKRSDGTQKFRNSTGTDTNSKK